MDEGGGSDNEAKRQTAISELIHTEESYLADLKLVVEVSIPARA